MKFFLILGIFLCYLGSVCADNSNKDSIELDAILSKIENVEKTPKIDDYVFLKRIYLNIVGRIPQLQEIKTFTEDSDSKKREKLIHKLMESEGYNSHMYNFFSNILRIKIRLDGNRGGGAYIDWIKNAIRKNKPFNVFAKELVGSEGPMWKKGNGATGYYVRDRYMQADNLSNTMRIFNGTRLECAQCHNHPFEDWKQKEFFNLLAFNGGMDYNIKPPFKINLYREFDTDEMSPKRRGILRKLSATFTDGITGSGTGAVRLPKDYQYEDGKPYQIVTAKSILGDKIELENVELLHLKSKKKKKRKYKGPIAKPIGSRKVFADWISSHNNPFFAKVIANRMWKKAYGYAIIEPLDDMTSESKPRNEKLMSFLEQKMKDFDFDLKRFQLMIYNSKHFQSSASVLDKNKETIQTPMVVRMTAEQIWDSILALVVDDIDAPVVQNWERTYKIFERMQVDTKEELIVEVEKIMSEIEAGLDSRVKIKQIQKQYHRKIRQLNKKKKWDDAKKARAELEEKITAIEKSNNLMLSVRSAKSKNSFLARASQMSSMPGSNHILTVFGKSNGDVIDGAHKESVPTQALFLLNGALGQAGIYRGGSQLMDNIHAQKTAEDKIKTAFLSILCRNAEEDELKLFKAEQVKNKYNVFQDSITTLLCSAEFMFIQ